MESVLKPPPGMRWNNQKNGFVPIVEDKEEEEYFPSEDEEEEQAQSAGDQFGSNVYGPYERPGDGAK